MTSPEPRAELHEPVHPVRFVTAASLFDGHDASINIMRRILQSQGAEVIHLGHNRSVDEVVTAAVRRTCRASPSPRTRAATSSTSSTCSTCCAARGAGHVKVFGGGGGTIVADEIAELHAYGVAADLLAPRRPAPGPAGHDQHHVRACDVDLARRAAGVARRRCSPGTGGPGPGHHRARGRHAAGAARRASCAAAAAGRAVPVLGITGTGGSGKSSLTDELVRRFRLDHEDKLRIAVIAIDPTRRKGGGALLGDRIRMNAIDPPSVLLPVAGHPRRRHEVPEASTTSSPRPRRGAPTW